MAAACPTTGIQEADVQCFSFVCQGDDDRRPVWVGDDHETHSARGHRARNGNTALDVPVNSRQDFLRMKRPFGLCRDELLESSQVLCGGACELPGELCIRFDCRIWFHVLFRSVVGPGRSPFTSKPTYAGRTVGVVFRGHRQGPCINGGRERAKPNREAKKNPKPNAPNRWRSESALSLKVSLHDLTIRRRSAAVSSGESALTKGMGFQTMPRR